MSCELFHHWLSSLGPSHLEENARQPAYLPSPDTVSFGANSHIREKSPVRDRSVLYMEPQEAALSHGLNIAEAWGVHWDEFRRPEQLKALLSRSGVLQCCGCQNPLRLCPHVEDRELYVSTMWNSIASGRLRQGHCAHEYSGGSIFSASHCICQGQKYMDSLYRTPQCSQQVHTVCHSMC